MNDRVKINILKNIRQVVFSVGLSEQQKASWYIYRCVICKTFGTLLIEHDTLDTKE